MNGNDVTVLHAQVVAHNSIQTTATVIKIIITKDDKDSVLSLFATNEDRITTEKLESVHGVV